MIDGCKTIPVTHESRRDSVTISVQTPRKEDNDKIVRKIARKWQQQNLAEDEEEERRSGERRWVGSTSAADLAKLYLTTNQSHMNQVETPPAEEAASVGGVGLGPSAVWFCWSGVFYYSHVMAYFRSCSVQSFLLPIAAAARQAFQAYQTSAKLLGHQKVSFALVGFFVNSGGGSRCGSWLFEGCRARNHNRGGVGILDNIVVCSLSLGGGGVAVLGSEQTSMALAETTPASEAEEKQKNNGAPLPDLLTEFMVDMTCEGCIKAVRSKVEPLQGVKKVEVDLENQVVRILGSASVKNLLTAIEASGRGVRLIGQGLLSTQFTVSAAVAEFKGPQIHGVVRFSQVSMETSRIEAYFSGLTAGKHGWSINMYGDLTQGAASTGGVYKLEPSPSSGSTTEAMGDMGTLEVGSDGTAEFNGRKLGLQVHDLIGRAVVIYENEDKSKDGITAAVIARSAGVGQNYKKICSCDGTIIWESSNSDFVNR